jgi:hypothetical protein
VARKPDCESIYLQPAHCRREVQVEVNFVSGFYTLSIVRGWFLAMDSACRTQLSRLPIIVVSYPRRRHRPNMM